MKSISRLFIIFFGFTFFAFSACNSESVLFKEINSAHSGIHFNNKIIENDTINPIDVTNIYNGGGVGVGDFNNDGLQDVYFTGNLVPNRLYINKGKFKFEDITQKAGVGGDGKWSRGVAVVDINNDGWQDMYVCASMLPDAHKRENLLYINQGADKSGIPIFKEMASAYGLNDTTHSTMSAFFDYDNDGDLDMYLVVNEILNKDVPSVFRPKITDGSHPSTGRLYRNKWNEDLKHPVFSNVTKEAGLTIEGYGHGVSISDLNLDGWKDIFITNDFNSNDLLYINNGDGTFTDKAAHYFKHTSANGMGQDVIDINNDGLSDVIELDMNPEDNYRKKMMMGANSYQLYQNSDYYGYQYQYVRNTLQLNQGPRIENDSVGDPIFSDIGYFAGIAETDWSWAPLVTDFDNDGFRDIYVTNGFPKDVTDHDFIAFRKGSYSIASKEYTLSQIPEVKLHNYAFRNNGNLTFNNQSFDWGLSKPTFSNGAAYADLDNDGDMDMVINNINDEALIYENTLMKKNAKQHFLSIKLKGDERNRNGLGAWVEIFYGDKKQVYEQTPYRGYLSTIQLNPHFGLGATTKLDSILVKWPNGSLQKINNVKVDQTLEISAINANEIYTWNKKVNNNSMLSDITNSSGIAYKHNQTDFIDFNIQKLLPHKFSEYGPALAIGDVDGNKVDDIIVGGSYGNPTTIILQQQDGSFIKKLLPITEQLQQRWQDMGLSLFDADKDGDLDLFIARGGFESEPNSVDYKDKLLLNDGLGNFTNNADALPQNNVSKSCVRVSDYDKDGDMDLFIGGRVEPWNYPKAVSSFIYRNDSKNGQTKFSDVTNTVAPGLIKVGLTCDALWTDFDNDGWQDILVAGEWMPLRFFKNNQGVFKEVTNESGTANKLGWWTSILPGDFDNDGDIDYIAGNLGLNSFFKATESEPVRIYAKDFDGNGSYDAVPTLFLPSSDKNPERKEYPAHTRDDMTKQLISFKSKFQNYKSYATADFSQMFKPEELKDAQVLKANYLSNSLVKNLGNGKFEITPLPLSTQYSCINGMLAEDIDGDGNLDVLINGNDYGTEVTIGRYDACNGVLLKGDGKGNFSALSILQSGWFVPGDGKSLAKFKNAAGATLIAASQNKGILKIYKIKRNTKTISLLPNDVSAMLHYKNGKKQLQEITGGSSFLSQSGRFINIDNNVSSIEINNNDGKKRTLKF